jgi:hypothetical protein
LIVTWLSILIFFDELAKKSIQASLSSIIHS